MVYAITPRQVAVASSAVLLLALLFPRLGLLQGIFNLVASAAILTAALSIGLIYALHRHDQNASTGWTAFRLEPLAFVESSQDQQFEDWTLLDREFLPLASDGVRRAFDRFMSLIKLHFILPWYSRISPSPVFPNGVDSLVRQLLGKAIEQGEVVDWSSVMVLRIVPLIRDHLKHYRSIEHLASTLPLTSGIHLPLPPHPHPALSAQSHHGADSPTIEMHLRQAVDRLLKELVPVSEQSEVVMILMREILLGAVMLPVFDMLVDGDFWNRQIEERAGQYLLERKQVNRFLSALSTIPDTPSITVTPVKSKAAYPPPSSTFISAYSSTHQFDAFIRSISRLKTLGEARRFRADIEREMRSAQSTLKDMEGRADATRDGERDLKRAKKYVQRLERARNQVDTRIGTFSNQSGETLQTSPQLSHSPNHRRDDITLYTVLLDPSSLAYWLEFMERRGRAKLVQFWLTLEGFKDPLEAGVGGTITNMTSLLQSDDEVLRNNPTIVEDATLLFQSYFTGKHSPLPVPEKHIATMKAFTNSEVVSAEMIRGIKHSFAASQQTVFDQMLEEDWSAFLKSELYLKASHDVRIHLSQPTTTVLGTIPTPPSSNPQADHSIPKYKRQFSAPLLPQPKRPPPRSGPSLMNGSFSPFSPTKASPSVSIAPPLFENAVDRSRQTSMGGLEQSFSHADTTPSTPGANPRRSSHLEVLIRQDGNESPELPGKKKPIFGEDETEGTQDDEDDFIQIQRMEAIQAALSEIIATDDLADSRILSRRSPTPNSPIKSLSASLVLPDTPTETEVSSKAASRSLEDLSTTLSDHPLASASAPQSRIPSGSQRPKVSKPALKRRDSLPSQSPSIERPRLFDDAIHEVEDDPDNPANDAQMVQLAAPGNLFLHAEIARLDGRVVELVKQEHLLDTLIGRAELTGNEAELKILQRSISAVQRDLRGAIFQKTQYEQQEEENRLDPARTSVTIPNAQVSSDISEGKPVARYAIKIHQNIPDRTISWSIHRRYNEFFELDRALREWTATAGDRELLQEVKGALLDLPGKKLGLGTSSSLVESRRQGLERYLQTLISSRRLCESDLLRAFLSRSSNAFTPLQIANATSLAPHSIVKSLYRSVATTLDDAPLGPSMLDLIQTTLNRQLSDVAGGLGEVVELGGELFGFGSGLLPPALIPVPWSKADTSSGKVLGSPAKDPYPISTLPIGGESANTVFTAPICELFIEVFDLEENNWLRRQAIVVILQQFLGSTIERKVRDTLRNAVASDSIERVVSSLADSLFPDGQRRPPSEPRTESERTDTRQRAARRLGLLIPDIAANMIGRGNARRAARRVFGVLQDRRLNQHLILSIIDALMAAMFPSNPKQSGF